MIKEFLENYLRDLKSVIDNLSTKRVEEVVHVVWTAYKEEHQIFVMGNGGSGATASHFTCDVNKGVSFGMEKRFKVICLTDNIPTMLAYANDSSYEDIFVEQLKNFLEPNDVVIGISGSGNSKNIIKAIEYANSKRAKSIGFTGFEGGELARIAKISIVVPSNDMQKIEDLHMIITHMIMQVLREKIRAEHGK